MKRILILLALVIVAITANAQRFSAGSYYEFTGAAGDTAISGTDASVIWRVTRDDIYLFRVEVELDEITNGANGIAILQGSLNGTDWFEVDTLAGSTGAEAQAVDATVTIQDLSTGVAWRYMKIIANISTTGKWDINYIRFRAVAKND